MPDNSSVLIRPETAEQAIDKLIDALAYRIRSLREHHHLRQQELAARCKLRQQTISKLENGDYRRNEFLVSAYKVATYFHIEPQVFLFGATRLSPLALELAAKWDLADSRTKQIVSALLAQ
jgi:transcriptional regulator with XRE-family HTH domain